MYIILSILLVLAILYIVCVNTLDKWRFRADRQYLSLIHIYRAVLETTCVNQDGALLITGEAKVLLP